MKETKKELLTVMTSREDKFFIMGNHGQLVGTPYFDNYHDCIIAIFKMTKENKNYTNLYDISENQYQEYFGQ